MTNQAGLRLAGLLVVFSVLAGLCVWYGALGPAPSANAYPGTDDVLADDDRYVGERVSVAGTVVETDPLTIELDAGPDGSIRLTVADHDASAAVGDELAVYGVLQDDRTVRAIGTVSYTTGGLWYAWVISVLAGLWVLARVLRHWTVDATELALRPRATASEGEDRA